MSVFKQAKTWTTTLFLLCAVAALPARATQNVVLPDFTKLVAENGKAVVNVSTVQKIAASKVPHIEMPDLPPDSPFGELFKKFFGEGQGGGNGPELDARSLGSGFIISSDGYILTNYHVVKDATEIVVRLNDRRQLTAKVVGFDKRSDIALLKIKADHLPVVKIGDSSKLKAGQWVLAIGSPFGFESSVTAGIVSATGRNLPSENYVPFIQTDVPINPGNSGGPLIDMDGNVVGINSQIYSRTGGYMGLSFAIPIEVAMDVVHQLKTKGHVTRGWLGVLIQDVTRELAESFGMGTPRGALVAKVMPNGPAAKAGIKVGDVIVEFDGQQVNDSGSLPPMVGTTGVGRKVPVKVIRNGHTRVLTVSIGELPEEVASSDKGQAEVDHTDNRLGLDVGKLGDDQRKAMGLDKRGGVVVKNMREGAAAEAGIRRGDVILMLDGKQVTGPAQFAKLVDALPGGKSVAMLVQRGDGPIFVAVKVPKKGG